MPSPNGGLIALQSHTGSGTFFIDFFDGKTGVPVCRAESGKMLEDSGWLSDRQFVAIPAGSGDRRLLSCRLLLRALPSPSKGLENILSAVQGRIITLEERAVDEDGNGLTDHLAVSAVVEVSEAGVYLFELQLENSGKRAVASGKTVLPAGQGRISVKFPSKELVRLGDGPHERWNARLHYVPAAGKDIGLDSRARAGRTAALPVRSLEREGVAALRLTGENSAEASESYGGTLFDTLFVRIGIHSTADADCRWNGHLFAGGVSIEHVSGDRRLRAGENSITAQFSGRKIRTVGRDGPYVMGNFGVRCPGADLFAKQVYATAAFRATQFRGMPEGFTFIAEPATVTMAAGSSTMVRVHVGDVVEDQHQTHMMFAGLPEGMQTRMFPFAIMPEHPGSGTLELFALPSVVPGSYRAQLKVRRANGEVRALELPITIAPLRGYGVAASPVGPALYVNGVWQGSPANLQWAPGEVVQLAAPSPQQVGQARYTFLNWSDGGAKTHTVTAAEGGGSYVAHFRAEYDLRTFAERGGRVMPAPGYQSGHVPILVQAIPDAGYAFAGWSGAEVAGGAEGAIVLTGPVDLTARFVPAGKVSLAWKMGRTSGTVPGSGIRHRTWHTQLVNDGESAIESLKLTKLTVQQTSGGECVHQLQTSMPEYPLVPTPGASVEFTIPLAVMDCRPDAEFQVTGEFLVNKSKMFRLTLNNVKP